MKTRVPRDSDFIEYHEPHSAFQKLIGFARNRCGFSVAELAEKIGVSQATLWIWLHNTKGFPDPKSFNDEHVHRLGKILNIPEARIRDALDASRPFDGFGRFIEILENDPRRIFLKSYILHIAKNLYRGAKVTLLLFAATLLAASARADELITVNGKRYEKVRVTEVTPTTIAFMHATGVARLPFTDFSPDVQHKYGYDEAKARAWLLEQAKAEQEQQRHEAAAEREKRARALVTYQQVDQMASALGNTVYDDATHRWYHSQEEAAFARERELREALKDRYLYGGQR